MNHEYNNHIKNFIDIMYSHFFQPCITEPTRSIGRNKTLIDKVFINTCTKNRNAENIIGKISDHLPNFLITQNLKEERLKRKIKIKDKNNFELEIFFEYLGKQTYYIKIIKKYIENHVKNT